MKTKIIQIVPKAISQNSQKGEEFMKKRLFSLFLVTAMAVGSLTACGGGSTETGDGYDK